MTVTDFQKNRSLLCKQVAIWESELTSITITHLQWRKWCFPYWKGEKEKKKTPHPEKKKKRKGHLLCQVLLENR